ncbi:MAG: HD domain-containing protein [Proteobacteria bacterium]|nr:HD domain-containing protein [Pseudomonadota bacterium]
MTTNMHELLNAAVEQLPVGVIIISDNDEVIFVNRAAEEIRHIQADQVIGRSVVSCHPEKSFEKVKRALQFLRREETKTFKRMVTDTAKNRYYENTYAAVRDSNNNYIGALIISRDITDRRKLEEERKTYLQNLEERVTELKGKLQDLFISSMNSLVNALEAKDPYTKGHSLRVCNMAVKMAEHKYGVSPKVSDIELSSKLHDIGKVGIREAILNKPGKLTDEEFNHIKEHTIIGEAILLPIEELKSVAKAAKYHHERFDGTGYPDGLKGEEIPDTSRIIAIADTYDAMTSARPYRPAMKPEKAAEEIKKQIGTQFDPQWGEIFLDLFYSGSIG